MSFLGSHLYKHLNCAIIGNDRLKQMQKRNVKYLSKFPNFINYFAYPFGQPIKCFNDKTNNILRKQKQGVELSRLETRFLHSRPNIFIISRKKFISSAWYFEMDRARGTSDDRNGVSTNHTRYSSCEDCEMRRVVNF